MSEKRGVLLLTLIVGHPVVKLLAEKFGFTTNFLREHIVDIEISNGTYAGMLYRVSDIFL